MRKILLVTEEYTEMLFLETLLKKVGFAVESLTQMKHISKAGDVWKC